jgi:MFS family permease
VATRVAQAKPAEAAPRGSRRVVAAVALAVFCVDVDFFALNLALPATARELHVTTTDLQWAIAVYQLTLASFLIPGGRLGDLLGRKRMLLAGIGIFGLASLLCGASQSAEMLIAMRFLQGIAASLLFPVGISVISNAFPVAERGKAIGNVYGFGAIGTAIGPFVGGLLTDAIAVVGATMFEVLTAEGRTATAAVHAMPRHDPRTSGPAPLAPRALVAAPAGAAAGSRLRPLPLVRRPEPLRARAHARMAVPSATAVPSPNTGPVTQAPCVDHDHGCGATSLAVVPVREPSFTGALGFKVTRDGIARAGQVSHNVEGGQVEILRSALGDHLVTVSSAGVAAGALDGLAPQGFLAVPDAGGSGGGAGPVVPMGR